ncbi:hypothetical protein SPI_04993 [Niveomyces insectorum RCEF 264]|uniref:Uncharacterized protein n=1 Tax=Niveomyces insectorum RCEF 264 TaxID=1081102 RepID=A0A167TUS7_9HYPO|nr:hypothetical protein SPI_04993 [Niveomyces insectorum RCEF 264]
MERSLAFVMKWSKGDFADAVTWLRACGFLVPHMHEEHAPFTPSRVGRMMHMIHFALGDDAELTGKRAEAKSRRKRLLQGLDCATVLVLGLCFQVTAFCEVDDAIVPELVRVAQQLAACRSARIFGDECILERCRRLGNRGPRYREFVVELERVVDALRLPSAVDQTVNSAASNLTPSIRSSESGLSSQAGQSNADTRAHREQHPASPKFVVSVPGETSFRSWPSGARLGHDEQGAFTGASMPSPRLTPSFSHPSSYDVESVTRNSHRVATEAKRRRLHHGDTAGSSDSNSGSVLPSLKSLLQEGSYRSPGLQIPASGSQVWPAFNGALVDANNSLLTRDSIRRRPGQHVAGVSLTEASAPISTSGLHRNTISTTGLACIPPPSAFADNGNEAELHSQLLNTSHRLMGVTLHPKVGPEAGCAAFPYASSIEIDHVGMAADRAVAPTLHPSCSAHQSPGKSLNCTLFHATESLDIDTSVLIPSQSIDVSAEAFERDVRERLSGVDHQYYHYRSPGESRPARNPKIKNQAVAKANEHAGLPPLVVNREAFNRLPQAGWIRTVLSSFPTAREYPMELWYVSKCTDTEQQQQQQSFPQCGKINRTYFFTAAGKEGLAKVFKEDSRQWEGTFLGIPSTHEECILFGCRFYCGMPSLDLVRGWDGIESVFVSSDPDGTVFIVLAVDATRGFKLAMALIT